MSVGVTSRPLSGQPAVILASLNIAQWLLTVRVISVASRRQDSYMSEGR